MTGALVINVTSGNLNTLGLRVINSLSGASLHAEKQLTLSGVLTVEGSTSTSGALLYAQGSAAPKWMFDRDYERFTVYGTNAKIFRGSGANFLSAFSGAIIGAQILQRLAGSGLTVHLYVNNTRVTTTALTTDNNEVSSTTAATPMVLGNARFSRHDTLRFDVSGTGSRAGTGLNLLLLYEIYTH